jgi:hypothetical protein
MHLTFPVSLATLVHPALTVDIPVECLVNQCDLFSSLPVLAATPYTVLSSVSLGIFRDFVAALAEMAVEITHENVRGLSLLCSEFGFSALSRKLADFRASGRLGDDESGTTMAGPEGRELQGDRDFTGVRRGTSPGDPLAVFHFPHRGLSGRPFTFLVDGREIESDVAEAVALSPLVREQLSVDACAGKFAVNGGDTGDAFPSLRHFHSAGAISADESECDSLALLGRLLGNPAVERLFVSRPQSDPMPVNVNCLSRLSFDVVDNLLSSAVFCVESEDALMDKLLKLGPAYSPLLRWIRPGFLSPNGLCSLLDHLAGPPEWAWLALPVLRLIGFDSLIISNFPGIFTELKEKRFSLLWRGTRDGFGAGDFHCRCDDHCDTLTVILDTNENVFGGFTPVKWKSLESDDFLDGGMKNLMRPGGSFHSFLFTLRNPHNIPARRFVLKPDVWMAVGWAWDYGPCYGRDISVFDKCNANSTSDTDLGDAYTNDTGLNGHTVFTGSKYFQVKEIEVFEIIE